jgi:two-component system alkaline phosphatase synthesis response regulator PhoP
MIKTNILFVADNFVRFSLIIDMLKRNNFSVLTATTSREVNSIIAERKIDMLIISQNTGDMSGLVLLKEIRNSNHKDIPVVGVVESSELLLNMIPDEIRKDLIFSSASTPRSKKSFSSITYKLAFFQLGADECLTCDQDLHESIARIKAVMRRVGSSEADSVVKINEIELNMSSYTVRIGTREIKVTAKEFDLLYVFLSSPERVLSRPYLLERIWGFNYFGSPRTVDVHIRRLRAKMGSASKYIHTVPCVGYKFIP